MITQELLQALSGLWLPLYLQLQSCLKVGLWPLAPVHDPSSGKHWPSDLLGQTGPSYSLSTQFIWFDVTLDALHWLTFCLAP